MYVYVYTMFGPLCQIADQLFVDLSDLRNPYPDK